MNKILVTGFEAFHGETVNPSQKIIESLSTHENLRTLLLPVHFERAFESLKNIFLREQNFEAILMLGQALKRDSVQLERVASNWVKMSPQDQNSNIIQNGRIEITGPDAYLNPWIQDDWLSELNQLGPTQISLSAGDYVCNYIYYQSIHRLTQNKIPTLFVHLPGLPEQFTSRENSFGNPMAFYQQLAIVQKIIEKLSS